MKCIFCSQKFEYENELAGAFYDKFPVNDGHMLFITKRHAKTYFDITVAEERALFELVRLAKIDLDKKYHPSGYNVGFNCGVSAGQSIMHVHLHLIPRYDGDILNPRGGIRGVIASKKDY